MKKARFVELVKELAVQGQMLDVLLKLQFALNGDTANVLLINREVPNVDQDLIQFRTQKKRKIQMKDKCVELAKELAVQGQMMDVLLKLQFVLNGDTASVLHIDQEILNVDQASDYISISFVNCLFYNLDIITSVSIVKLN